jgi:hypothetical protein
MTNFKRKYLYKFDKLADYMEFKLIININYLKLYHII